MRVFRDFPGFANWEDRVAWHGRTGRGTSAGSMPEGRRPAVGRAGSLRGSPTCEKLGIVDVSGPEVARGPDWPAPK